MTRGTFGSYSFIAFIASQFITDFSRFGQDCHDPTPVLTKSERLVEGLLLLLPGMPSNTRGTIEGTLTERGVQ